MFEVSTMADEALVDVLRGTEARIAAAQADALAITAELYARCPQWITTSVPGLPDLSPVEVTAAEIGTALALSKLVATDRVELAVAATSGLQRSVAALGRGQLTLSKLRILLEHTAELSPQQVAAVEEHVLPRAAGQTPSVFGALIRRTVLRLDPAAPAPGWRSHPRARRRVVSDRRRDGHPARQPARPAGVTRLPTAFRRGTGQQGHRRRRR